MSPARLGAGLVSPSPVVVRRLVLGSLLGVLASLSSIGLLLVSGWLISRAAEQPPVLYLMVAIVSVRAFGIARAVFRYAERLVSHDAALRVATGVRVAVFERVERLAPSTLRGARRGDTVQRVVGDVDAVQDLVIRVVQPAVVLATAVLAVTGLVLLLSPVPGLILLGAVMAAVLLVPPAVGLGSRSAAHVSRLRGDLAAAVAEAAWAQRDLVVLGAGAELLERVETTDRALASAQRRAAFLDGWGTVIVRVAVGAAVCLICFVGTGEVASGRLEPVLLAVVVLAPIALLEPLEALPVLWQQYRHSAAAVDRLAALASTPEDVVEPPVPAVLPTAHGLTTERLDAGWPPSPPVVRALDLHLPEGGSTALVGPSGSGKSTVAQVLLRMVEPMGGRVLLGGTPTGALSGDDVRTVVGMLGQDEHVFDTSVRENLRVADPGADDERLHDALRRAGLASFLAALPDGLDTMVGENGNRLSGGERQRLGLARILLGDHRVLILDEPVEHLDRETAEILLRDLLALRAERSILLVTHDLGALRHVDRVIDVSGAAVAR